MAIELNARQTHKHENCLFHRKVNVSATAVATTSKDIPKQTAFGMDEDSESELQNRYGQAFTGTQTTQDKARPSAISTQPPVSTLARPKYTEPPPQIPKPPTRQAVLDKFGNFRLPSTEKPPEPAIVPRRSRSSRSRSRSRRRYSGSRSRYNCLYNDFCKFVLIEVFCPLKVPIVS